jgi:hypothetical protein
MKRTFVAVAALGFTLAACNNADSTTTPTDPSTSTSMPIPEPIPPEAGGVAALGMTEAQLLDADLKDAAGKDLGDVEGLVRDAAGAVTHLVVKVDDTTPDKLVQVPVTGLQMVESGDDRDITTTLTQAQLVALPAATATTPAAAATTVTTTAPAPAAAPAK